MNDNQINEDRTTAEIMRHARSMEKITKDKERNLNSKLEIISKGIKEVEEYVKTGRDQLCHVLNVVDKAEKNAKDRNLDLAIKQRRDVERTYRDILLNTLVVSFVSGVVGGFIGAFVAKLF